MKKTILYGCAILLIAVLGLISTFAYIVYSPNSPYLFSFRDGLLSQPHFEYIPADIEDAHERLLAMLPTEEIERIRSFENEEKMIGYHFGLGLWMRNHWGLWGGSRLSRHFNHLGIHHPDDHLTTGDQFDTDFDHPFTILGGAHIRAVHGSG